MVSVYANPDTWSTCQGCVLHRKKVRQTGKKSGMAGKKSGFAERQKPPQTRMDKGFPGCPRARARKNKKKLLKNPCGQCLPCGYLAPQRGALWPPGFAPCGLDQNPPPGFWTPPRGVLPHTPREQGAGVALLLLPRLRLGRSCRVKGSRFAPASSPGPFASLRAAASGAALDPPSARTAENGLQRVLSAWVGGG